MALLQELPFSKYSGCGNDFVLVSGRHLDLHTLAPLVPRLCHRWEGIGADGVLLVEESIDSDVDAYVHIFNADGSSAELCGNGLRCVARYLHEDLGKRQSRYLLATAAGRYLATPLPDNNVEVALGSATPLSGPEETELFPYPFYSLTVGVPHAVIFCPTLDDIDVCGLGRQLRYSKIFAPAGTNVNFASRRDDHTITLRTYERGVEAETWACGSGAAATAIAAAYHYALKPPLQLITRHGATLHYTFELSGRRAENLMMQGPSLCCFRGSYPLL